MPANVLLMQFYTVIMDRQKNDKLTLFVSDIHPAESLNYVLDRFKAQAEGKIKIAANVPCLRKEHKLVLTNVCTSNVLFNNKVHNIGFFSDISETKQLTEEHSRLTAAIEQTNEVVVITDIEGDIQYVNPAFGKVSGYTKKEALGQNPRINKGTELELASTYGIIKQHKGDIQVHSELGKGTSTKPEKYRQRNIRRN